MRVNATRLKKFVKKSGVAESAPKLAINEMSLGDRYIFAKALTRLLLT